MFCTKCGKPFEGEGIVCPECAAKNVPEEVAAPVEEVVAPTVIDEVAPPAVEQAPVFAEAVPQENIPEFTVASTEEAPKKKKKKKKLGLTLGIIGGILAVLGVLCFFFWGWITSLFNRTVLPADTYLKKVETKALEKNADKLADGYEALLNTELTVSPNGDIDGQVITSDTLLSLLQPYLPEEFGDGKWLADVMVDVDYSYTDTAAQCSLCVGLAEEPLLTVNAVLDLEEGLMYVAIPELNATPIRVEFDAEVIEEYLAGTQTSQKLVEAVLKSLPDKETFRTLIVDYMTLVINELDQVEKEQTEIFIGTQSMKVTALTATIQQDDMLDAAETVLTKAQTDPVITNFLNTLANNLQTAYPEGDFSFDSSDYMAAVADAIDAVRSARTQLDYSVSVLYTSYVDHQDNIVGRKLATSEAGVVTELFHYYTLYSTKDNYTYELYIPGNEVSETVMISGTYVKENNAASVSCAIQVDGKTYLTLELNNMTADGGTIRILPGKPLIDMVLESAQLDIPSALIADVAFELSYNGTKATLAVKAGGEAMLTVKLDTKKGIEEITIPGNSVNSENNLALGLWFKSIDFDAYFEKLENAGVPADIIELIQDYMRDELNLPL